MNSIFLLIFVVAGIKKLIEKLINSHVILRFGFCVNSELNIQLHHITSSTRFAYHH